MSVPALILMSLMLVLGLVLLLILMILGMLLEEVMVLSCVESVSYSSEKNL
jgi:hypothetical protein